MRLRHVGTRHSQKAKEDILIVKNHTGCTLSAAQLNYDTNFTWSE